MVDDGDWIEMFKIQQLIYRYFDSVNRGDLETMRTLFADDAVWEEPLFDLRQDSADGFVEFFRHATAKAELLIITPHCPAITLLSSNSAQATTTLHEFTRGTPPEDGSFGPEGAEVNFQHIGIYTTTLRSSMDRGSSPTASSSRSTLNPEPSGEKSWRNEQAC